MLDLKKYKTWFDSHKKLIIRYIPQTQSKLFKEQCKKSYLLKKRKRNVVGYFFEDDQNPTIEIYTDVILRKMKEDLFLSHLARQFITEDHEEIIENMDWLKYLPEKDRTRFRWALLLMLWAYTSNVVIHEFGHVLQEILPLKIQIEGEVNFK